MGFLSVRNRHVLEVLVLEALTDEALADEVLADVIAPNMYSVRRLVAASQFPGPFRRARKPRAGS